jgi:hypothetical protein
MTEIKFTDGMTFKLDGPLRAECRSDGWYVVGAGMLMPANSYEDAKEMIEKMKE